MKHYQFILNPSILSHSHDVTRELLQLKIQNCIPIFCNWIAIFHRSITPYPIPFQGTQISISHRHHSKERRERVVQSSIYFDMSQRLHLVFSDHPFRDHHARLPFPCSSFLSLDPCSGSSNRRELSRNAPSRRRSTKGA